MRTGAAAGHLGYFHEAVCYDSDEDLVAVVLPFLLSGIAAGEPTLVSLNERRSELVRSALPADSAVRFLDGGDIYSRPAAAIRSYRQMLADHVAAGAGQIRIVGEVPAAGLNSTWDWWARYESAINHAYDEFPLWSMCVYDRRVTPAPVLADVLRTHPRVALPDGRRLTSGTYTDPLVYLTEPRPARPDPIQYTPPLVELVGPTPARARAAVYDADRGHLPPDDVENLVVAVSETVTNALRHGREPVTLRLWSGPDRIVVSVHDGGEGPKDPFAGLLPAGDGTNGGLGLWITHQSCNHVAMHRGPDGFTVRLTGGNAHVDG
ncbi:transcriptional regulator [Micromonospora echinospora]|uniref:Histidine kinase-like ATPase domain-containing protein n=1 Tax=Micromonospora echinospora TaxID=1877 RepID=A0A1C4ZU62_MICEC|nr:sensor histidine kinase [Micromonospora echinospora]OZV83984.1 transcriptional regulator [Micromonospora echinospora]SCF36500.1 Histidine kinase-like ATPase domain-containing protein [Micromonospora echinospora]